MINRIRDVRKEKGLTLADVAARCMPATTAQTIGRLETGTRGLSLTWMNRIAAALGVDPEVLVRGDEAEQPRVIARLLATGADALSSPRDAVLPVDLAGEGALVVLTVEASAGEYRAGDQLWLRQTGPGGYARLLDRDVLAPRPGGRFAFGRLIAQDGDTIALLPPDPAQRRIAIESPPWLAGADMLVRRL